MIQTVIALLTSSFLLIGCSSSSSTDTNSTQEKNSTIIIDTIPEPLYYQQWYLDYNETFYEENGIDSNASIHSDELLFKYTGKGIKIAIIDDGLDVEHEDLNGSVVSSFDINFRTSDVTHTNITDYHGTAVTGIIAARRNGIGMHGIASEAEIIFLKYEEYMSDSETIELFDKAVELGADIINCSWGTYDVSASVRDKIVEISTTAKDGQGIPIVFAVGNSDLDMGNDESSIPEVISVGSVDVDNLRAWYSDYGKELDVVAPAGYYLGITTLDPMGAKGIASENLDYLLYDDYNSFIGSSAAAPIVSGVIALMLEEDPTLTREEIDSILKNTADKIGTLIYEDGRNSYYGYGKINVTSIFDLLQEK